MKTKSKKTEVDLKQEFPALFNIILELSLEMETRPRGIVNFDKTKLKNLEAQAKKLNLKKVDDPTLYCEKYSNELSLITDPCDDDAGILAKSKNIQDLNKFLGKIFNGSLTKVFLRVNHVVDLD